MTLVALIVLILLASAVLLWVLRFLDLRAERREWDRLAARQPPEPLRFRPEMVAHLPEPARRYFNYVIRPGTPLLPVAEIDMRGRFALGPKHAPGYREMQARQILAAPEGFVWSMRTRGGMQISGSDSALWTRFRIFGIVPVARKGGSTDHRRAAFGRYVAEAVFWTPAALLPGPGVTWEAVNKYTARVTVRHRGLLQPVDVAISADGRPRFVSFQRWSDANPDRTHRLQPFGGTLSDFRDVGGYRLPFKVEAGNMFGMPEYFPFFIAQVTAVRFPRSHAVCPGAQGSAKRFDT